MKSISVLFVGCGDLGIRTGVLLQRRGWNIAGFRRNPSRLPAGFIGYAGDYSEPGSLDFIAELRPDHVVLTCNPVDRSVAGYRRGFAAAAQNLLAGLGSHAPRSIITVSSTRVFAEQRGGWVEEDSELVADDPRALPMIEAEQLLLRSRHPACVVRFAGIYGFQGGRLLQRIRRGQLSPEQPLRYGNRIHRDDCAGFLAHLLELAESGSQLAPVYIGADDAPAPRFEVESWLAREMGVVAAPADVSTGRVIGDAPAGTMPTGHKRCRNRLLHASGYQLRYPDYRSGYRAVLAADTGY